MNQIETYHRQSDKQQLRVQGILGLDYYGTGDHSSLRFLNSLFSTLLLRPNLVMLTVDNTVFNDRLWSSTHYPQILRLLDHSTSYKILRGDFEYPDSLIVSLATETISELAFLDVITSYSHTMLLFPDEMVSMEIFVGEAQRKSFRSHMNFKRWKKISSTMVLFDIEHGRLELCTHGFGSDHILQQNILDLIVNLKRM
jgi:hypothetical protein